MKFLIATDADRQGFRSRASDLSAADFGGYVGDLFFRKSNGMLLLASDPPGKVSGTNVFWDGGAIDRDMAFSRLDPVADAPERLLSYLESLRQGQLPSHISGIFCAAGVTANNTVFIAPDPVSQYAVFYRRAGPRTFFSNCLHLMEKVLAVESLVASRDFASNAFELAFGAGGWTRSGLAEVYKLPPHQYAEVIEGELTFNTLPIDIFQQKGMADYPDKLKHAATRLQNNATALVARYPEKGLMLDLSGGKDTRLILGSFLSVGARHFQTFLGGSEDGEDRQGATRLVRHFGLVQGNYLSNLGREHLTAIDVARRSAYRFEGTSSLFQAVPGRERLSGLAQVRGGSSEAKTRSFYRLSDRWEANGIFGGMKALLPALARGRPHAWKRFVADANGRMRDPARALPFLLSGRGGRMHGFFRRSFLLSAFDSFSENLAALSSLGVSSVNLADTYYLFDRGWRHCGFPTQVMNNSRPVFEPLNDLNLLYAQMALTIADRDIARVARDLFDALGVPDLLEMPFEGGNWPTGLTEAQVARREELRTISTVPMTPNASVFRDPGGHTDSIYSLGGPAYMRAVQSYMVSLAGDLSRSSSVWDYLQRDKLIDAIQTGRFISNKFAHDGVRLLHGLIWMHGAEERV